MEHYIYVVFSATPYKIGKFIRTVTRQEYNHVSISLDDKLQMMYSFARHYKDTPFYGGFVKESCMRFYHNNKASDIQIFAIPLTNEEYAKVEAYIQSFQENENQYLYNLFSAICTPMHRRVHIDKSFTCIEFVVNVLSQVKPELKSKDFYAIMELKEMLKDYMVFNGSIEEFVITCVNHDEEFLKKHNIMFRSYYTLILLKKLVGRMWNNAYA